MCNKNKVRKDASVKHHVWIHHSRALPFHTITSECHGFGMPISEAETHAVWRGGQQDVCLTLHIINSILIGLTPLNGVPLQMTGIDNLVIAPLIGQLDVPFITPHFRLHLVSK